MKLDILQENLNKAISVASRFASTRAQLPILGNILISSKKTKVYISATNLEISVSIAVGAKVENEGDICIPSRVIAELVGNLPKGPLSIDTDKEHLKIGSPGFSSTVLGVIPNDFPKVPTSVSKEKVISLPKGEFIDALSQVVFASSSDETRPVLTGVLFIFSKNILTLVATDGFRLSRKTLKIEGLQGELRLILPKSILMEISRAQDENGDVLFSFNEKDKQAVFGVGDMVFSSRLLEGEYPDFEKIIPKTNLCKVRMDKEDLLRSVKLASIFARDSANIVRFKILKGSVKVVAESSSSGNQENSVEAEVEKSSSLADPFEIAFNFHFLEEFLHSVKGETVDMEFTSATTAGVFKEPGDENTLHLIMPVRVQD